MPNQLFKLKRTFVWIVLFVALAHALVLWSLGSLQNHTWESTTATTPPSFSTRTIAASTNVSPKPASASAPATAQTQSTTQAHQATAVSSAVHHDTQDAQTDIKDRNTSESDTVSADALLASHDTQTIEATADQIPPAVHPVEPEKIPPQLYRIPPPATLKYDIKGEIKGFAYFANGQLRWQHNASRYEAQLEISHFLLGSRTQTSMGHLSDQGLQPQRFGDKVRSEVYAQLDHTAQQVTFSADGAKSPLKQGAQDQLSVFIQLSAMLAGAPEHFQPGDRLAFQAVGARSAENWSFEVGALKTLTLPGGKIPAIQLKRLLTDPDATQVEVWLAPSMDYLPVRIRLFQANGDFVEQQWRTSKKP